MEQAEFNRLLKIWRQNNPKKEIYLESVIRNVKDSFAFEGEYVDYVDGKWVPIFKKEN